MVYGTAPPGCPSPVSDPKVVSIYGLATSTNPLDATVCQASGTAFSITAGGAPAGIRWQRKTPTGAWTDITAGNVPADGCTYSNYTSASLTITNAANGMNGYQYRVKLTTTAGGCVTYSNAATLTVRPRATITLQPVAAAVCEGDNASFSVTANVALPSNITAWQWQRKAVSGSFTDITAGTDGGIYSNFNSATLNISNAPRSTDKYSYQCRITTTGGCTITSAARTITVNPYANITGQPPDRTVCEGYNTVFPVSDDNVFPVTVRQWQVSTDGGTSWNNLSNGGTYAGTTSSNLSVSNIPSTFSGYRYRCILTTAGMCAVTSGYGMLTVNPLPGSAITGSPVSDPVICAGQAATITLSNSVPGVSYQLQLDSDGSNVGVPVTGNGGDITFSVTPSQTTTYKVKAEIISTGCQDDLAGKAVVTVNPLPVPAISGNNNVCANRTGIVYTTSDARGRTFTWEISGGSISSGQGTNTVSVTWGAAGAGWLRVKEKITATGCENTTSDYNVTINPGAPSEIPGPRSQRSPCLLLRQLR
jgi:hypothetical protein